MSTNKTEVEPVKCMAYVHEGKIIEVYPLRNMDGVNDDLIEVIITPVSQPDKEDKSECEFVCPPFPETIKLQESLQHLIDIERFKEELSDLQDMAVRLIESYKQLTESHNKAAQFVVDDYKKKITELESTITNLHDYLE